MNRKMLIGIILVVLIVALAIFFGIKLSKDNIKKTDTNPVVQTSEIPTLEIYSTTTPEISTPTPETPAQETQKPEETVLPEVTPTHNQTTEVSTYSTEQKIEYAKSIAKETWEKLGVNKKVYYSFAEITSDGKYLIAVREEATTQALVWYKIDISNKTYEISY